MMAAFTFLDLPASKALFNTKSGFGRLFEAFGEVPCMLVASFCSAALWATRNKKSALPNVIGFVGFGALAVLFGLGAAMLPTQYIEGLPKEIAAVGIALAAGFMLLSLKIKKSQDAALRKAALVGLLTVVIALFGVNLLKMLWGRPRMRMMTDPDAEFAFWFMLKPFAPDNEHMSFPSGHAANAACILWITLLPTFCPRLRSTGWKAALWAFAGLWTLLVMVSRVIMGAHFLTDVTFGVGITLTSFTLLRGALIKQAQPTPIAV